MNKALVAGGITLAAVALRFAVAGAPANMPGAAPVSPMNTIAVETGKLYLLRLYDEADVSKLPQPYAPADYSRFSPERPGPTSAGTQRSASQGLSPRRDQVLVNHPEPPRVRRSTRSLPRQRPARRCR